MELESATFIQQQVQLVFEDTILHIVQQINERVIAP